jgi:mannose/fructose/N-acetylgalactosamine-specific phosphotransferase system component IIC
MMFSRPLVAGAITGALLGHPVEGVLVGAILEIFDLAILPIGAARYPEGGPAAVAAAAAYVAAGGDVGSAPGMLLMAVVFGLAWERVAGASVVLSRRITERFLLTEEPVTGDARHLERRHTLAMAIDFMRGTIVTLAGVVAGSILIAALGPLWPFGTTLTLGALVVSAALVLGGVLTVFGGFDERRNVFLIGVLCGSLALLLLRTWV